MNAVNSTNENTTGESTGEVDSSNMTKRLSKIENTLHT